jgi:hypothetical protein
MSSLERLTSKLGLKILATWSDVGMIFVSYVGAICWHFLAPCIFWTLFSNWGCFLPHLLQSPLPIHRTLPPFFHFRNSFDMRMLGLLGHKFHNKDPNSLLTFTTCILISFCCFQGFAIVVPFCLLCVWFYFLWLVLNVSALGQFSCTCQILVSFASL